MPTNPPANPWLQGRRMKPSATSHLTHNSQKLPDRKQKAPRRRSRRPITNPDLQDISTKPYSRGDPTFRLTPGVSAAKAAPHARGHAVQRTTDIPQKSVTIRAKPRRRGVRQTSAFLKQLPGEVRNRIYQYVIPSARVLICATKPNVEVAQAKKLWENEGKHIPKPRCRLYCILDREQLEYGLEISTSLLLVCKQISREAQHFLYSRTRFCFPNLKTVEKFFGSTTKSGIDSIRTIELETHCYGEPYLTQNRTFKLRYERKWESTCRLLGNNVPSLTHLKLHAHCSEWPSGKIEQTAWHKALAHITERKKLDSVIVALDYPWFSSAKLDKLQTQLENQMMTPESLQRRQDEEAKKTAPASPSRPVKCLRIVINNVASSNGAIQFTS